MPVDATEVRYVWKQLPYNISFYLGSKIEMTTDYPEIERGEVLCFPLRRQSGKSGTSQRDALQTVLYWTEPGGAAGSCLFGVSSILCKRQLRPTSKYGNSSGCLTADNSNGVPSTETEAVNKKTDENTLATMRFKATEHSVCMSSPLFWTLTSGTAALLLSLATATITLAVCSVRFRKRVNLGMVNDSFGYRCLSRQASTRLMLQQAAKQPSTHHQVVGGANLEADDSNSGFFL
ncbi:hypothetical protein BOX15_Mlig032967g1 [Macrostomum lignano]|uniref:Uncharacterized protein n=1 Tax=Macrostomum lignano TaxID=282301 RepID=A0A267FJ53_9PLAT|nr:hypothetical protein BOX15_Mlig032967g1 [Macrostomum lignano]